MVVDYDRMYAQSFQQGDAMGKSGVISSDHGYKEYIFPNGDIPHGYLHHEVRHEHTHEEDIFFAVVLYCGTVVSNPIPLPDNANTQGFVAGLRSGLTWRKDNLGKKSESSFSEYANE